MSAPTLCLNVTEFTDPDHWRWTLNEPGGKFLADHQIALNRADSSYAALIDLPSYLRTYSAPDTRDADERRLIAEAGAWIGEHVLGRTIAQKLLQRCKPSLVVRVQVPPEADRLLALPLEIARLDHGAPLSQQGVSFVFETTGDPPAKAESIGNRLRILALFSLPPVGSPLNLRRERQMLQKLVRQLTGAAGLAIDLHVLQYGVTRARLAEMLQQGEGWDVIHFSGHGQPGALLLERPDGGPDEVSSTDLAALLLQASGRVKLVTLSACLSAASTIAQTLSWLGFKEGEAAQRDAVPLPPDAEPASKAAPTVARALTQALDCAVLAMRYAVEDEFAMLLARELYDLLFRQKQPLPQATRLALASVSKPTASGSTPGALSTAAPALFGPRATDLILLPPKGFGIITDTSLAFIPKQPEHFVGRVAAMTRASVTLAAESTRSGTLFLGMAGAGKTSCAVELVYNHSAVGRFQAFVWFSAPEQGKDIELALRDFALKLEMRIPNLAMVQVIDRTDELREWLPRLIELLENNAILIVLDNMESLLTEAGIWRDEAWGMVVAALLSPGGLSRTVLTSRILPAALPTSAEVIRLHALPRDEALLLVREMPNLRRLLDGAAQTGLSQNSGRKLVRRVLRLVQGHPKLIELSEALAIDPAKLATRLDEADAAQATGTGELDAFFAEGASRLDEASFVTSLKGWTRGIVGALPEAARLFFFFLCAIEEDDRSSFIILNNWSDVWLRLGFPAPAPATDGLLKLLIDAALVSRQATGSEPDDYTLSIHPGVAEAGRAEAGPGLRNAVDRELGATWGTLFREASERHGRDAQAGQIIVRAGISGFPYLARIEDWNNAALMLERSLALDASPSTYAAVLPLMRRLVDATNAAKDRALLARVLRGAGRASQAELLLRAIIDEASGSSDSAIAFSASGDLANLLRDAGRLNEALQVLERQAEYMRQAGLGRWSQISNEGRRLQIYHMLGEHEAVLARVNEIRVEMRGLPETTGANDSFTYVWNVRETTLGLGRSAALWSGEWQQALDINGEVKESKKRRNASALDMAGALVNDTGPLLRLQRFDAARELLLQCRDVFEHENAFDHLGVVFGALADLEDELGHYDAARSFGHAALRYSYLSGRTESIRNNHFNLAIYLTRCEPNWQSILSHRLAAAVITIVIAPSSSKRYITALVSNIRQAADAAEAAFPGNFADLCTTVEQVEGVRFRELMQRLQPDEAALNQLFSEIIATAINLARTADNEPLDKPDAEGKNPMIQPLNSEGIARKSAASLADLDPNLLDHIENAIAADPLSPPTERLIDPISLAALIVSIAEFGWTLYRDLSKDPATSTLNRAVQAQHLTQAIQQTAIAAAPVHPSLTPDQRTRVITTVVTEIIAHNAG